MGDSVYRILIVEDDSVIAREIKSQIEAWGYVAASVSDLRNVMAEFTAFDPHLVIMDISLPFFDGYHWCSEIRRVSNVPIIFISSASDNMNIIMAVNMGGDDFISKPFDMSVLTAKVQAMLRRTYDFGGRMGLIEHRGAIFNTSDATLFFDGEKIGLIKNEYRILHILMENKGKTVSREKLMTGLWETDSFIDDNTLTVNVARLRKKLEEAGLHDFITTKKGIGYIIET